MSSKEFYSCLFRSQVVLDITTHENCLLCGAYEAMSACKPLVTSNSQILRTYFNKGTIYTEHDAGKIADAIRKAYETKDLLSQEICVWKKNAKLHHQIKIQELTDIIIDLV